MLNKLKKTAKHTIIYSIGNLSTKLIGFILLPLYTQHLSISDYGVLGILEVTNQFLIAVFGFRMSTAMLRWCASAKNEDEEKSIIFTTLLSISIIVLIFNLLFMPFRNEFSSIFFNTTQYSDYFLILFLSVSFGILNKIPFELIRFREKPVFFVTIASIKLATILTLTIYFIVVLKMGVKGIILSQLIGHIVLIALAIPFLLKNINWKFKISFFSEMFQYGFPLIFSTISAMLLTVGDRYIIKLFHAYSHVGVYSLGYKLASVINVFILQSFTMGFLPIAFKMYDKPDAKRFFSKTLTYLILILTMSALALSFFAKEIIVSFSSNRDYWIAYTVVPLLTLAFVLKGMQYVFSLGFHYKKKTKYNAYIVLAGLIMNLMLNFLLIPKFEIYGAAIATIFSALTITILNYYFSQKLYYVNYEISKILKTIIISIVLYMIALMTNDLNIIYRICVKSLLLLSLPVILYYFNFYEEIELQKIKQIWNKWKDLKSFKKNISKIKFK